MTENQFYSTSQSKSRLWIHRAHTMTSTKPSRFNRAAPFAATRWTVVLSARDQKSPESTKALETLCRNYWYPLYAYVRRQGRGAHDAEDLTQAFFARLLERNYLADVDQAKGKFRSFLIAALKHFLANEWDRANAQKRGGGKTVISIDRDAAENTYQFEPADTLSADKIFERRWAMTLLERTLQRLAAEYEADGKKQLFEELKTTITGDRGVAYTTMAARLGTSEGAIKVAAHRLRQRYRAVLRAEIAETVTSADELEDELRNLFAVLSGG
jgi:DNA-directed RNA polymerase specialized sigma24 family protein